MFRIKNIYSLAAMFIIVPLFTSCSGKKLSPEECVSAFIVAAQQHDMGKAWDLLSPEAQGYYNDIGDKNRKSGKGILEHDISEASSFLEQNKDFRIEPDAGNPSLIKIAQNNGAVFDILTVNSDGSSKIKGGIDVKNLIKAIAGKVTEKEYYN